MPKQTLILGLLIAFAAAAASFLYARGFSHQWSIPLTVFGLCLAVFCVAYYYTTTIQSRFQRTMALAFYSGAMLLLAKAFFGLTFRLAGSAEGGFASNARTDTSADAFKFTAELSSLLTGGNAALDLAMIPVSIAMFFFAFRLASMHSPERDIDDLAVYASWCRHLPRNSVVHDYGLHVFQPGWDKDLETVEATISSKEFEKALLFEEDVVSRLHTFGFDVECRKAYRTTVHELVANAFEHGTDSRHTVVTLRAEVCGIYASITVEDAKCAPGNLSEWIASAEGRLEESGFKSRGRGLILVSRVADALEMTCPGTVKAVVFKDRVHLSIDDGGPIPIVRAAGGQTNPGYGIRVRRFLEELEYEKLVLAIDPAAERRLYDADMETVAFFYILNLFLKKKNWRIVCSKDIHGGLVPPKVFHETIEDAVQSLSVEQ